MLIESVPNISEGRRPDVIGAIAGAVETVPGVLLLGVSSDFDHNRSVITLAGAPDALKQAILALYAAVLPRIDMRTHAGAHPRIGAVDAVPFIPLSGATMNDCVKLAREVASQIASRFDLPTFLYAQAASSGGRRKLSEIRRGEFEGLIDKLTEPAWKPDYGPALPHPTAGASAVGARDFLIAYNIQLDTPDVRIARRIARAVRESSGGLPGVQAMGVFLPARGRAQVSMNILDFERAPLRKVYAAVESLAERYGARVTTSELVGLAPQAAIDSDTARDLKIENWSPDIVLENALAAKGTGTFP